MRISLFRDLSFEAAHRNMASGTPPECQRLHGHSYRARVWLSGTVDPRLGWLRDFSEIKRACAPTIETLDHRFLNEVDGVRDGSIPDLTRWLKERLQRAIPEVERCGLETAGDSRFTPVVSKGDGAIPRIGFWFAAAHLLPMLPKDHKCRRLHGHSFHVEVSSAGDLSPQLALLHARLDHQYLNELKGLENPTSENLARWIWEELSAAKAHPTEVTIQETCTTGCAYRGN